jgi:putative ABC transport system ATP-binding protein
MRLLVEATRRNDASLIVVTHDPNVAGWCDRTVEVRDGLLLAGGVPA